MSTPTFVKPGDAASRLAASLTQAITSRSVNSPRSKQKTVGLSEIGEKCVRKSAYKVLGWPQIARIEEVWPSFSGTAIHAALADVFSKQPDRYLVEHKVTALVGFKGTCDLFDKQEKMVIDHKCVGNTSMTRAKKSGMSDQQRVQINLYGLGIENELGEGSVEQVALAFYPLGGFLSGMHTIVEPYDRQLAVDALERFGNIQQLAWGLDPEKNPLNWSAIPTSPSYNCTYCPWFLPNSTDLSKGCPGQVDAS